MTKLNMKAINTKNCYIRNKIGCHCKDSCGYEQTIIEVSHGGRRRGAGRKKGEPTKTIRVPVSKIEEVKKVIKK